MQTRFWNAWAVDYKIHRNWNQIDIEIKLSDWKIIPSI